MSDISATSNDRLRFLASTTPPAAPVTPKESPKEAARVLDAPSSVSAPPLDPAILEIARASAIAARNEAYFAASTGPYSITTTTGEKATVRAASQFRMVGGHNYRTTEIASKDDPKKKVTVCADGPPLMAALAPVNAKLQGSVNRVLTGRGTPEDVRAVTQRLIDKGKLGPVDPKDAEAAIQALQWKYGIGLDCAGYVQRAFFAARGMTGTPAERAALGLNELAVNENFEGLPKNPHFKSVSIAGARAGDVMLLDKPKDDTVGHVVLVHRNTVLSAADETKLGIAKGTFKGPVRMIEVDSSWGAGKEGKGGGVQRRTFVYDEGSGRWASYDAASKKLSFSEANGPYDHPLIGIYRPKRES